MHIKLLLLLTLLALPFQAQAQDICVDCDDPAPIVDKSEVVGISYTPGYTVVTMDELKDFLIKRISLSAISEKAHTIKLAYGIGYLDVELRPQTSRVTVTGPLLTIPGKPSIIERGSGPLEAAFEAFEDPSFGFEDPSFGFEDPSFGFEDPSFGFEDPSFGFEDPSFGFEDPSFGYQDPQATLDAIWGTNGTAYEDVYTNGVWGNNGVSFRDNDPNAIWGVGGASSKPFALIVFTVDADAELSHSGLIIPFTVPEESIKMTAGKWTMDAFEKNTAILHNHTEQPVTHTLESAYPNPFNPQTTLSFSMTNDAHARLAVYDMLGRQVALLVDGKRSKGSHTVAFEAASLPSGMYLVQFQAEGVSQTKQISLLK